MGVANIDIDMVTRVVNDGIAIDIDLALFVVRD